MKGPRASVGAELVPLVLILAALAGSLALVVSAHHRKGPKRSEKPAVSIAFAPAPRSAPKARQAPAPAVEDEPDPPPAPVPPDPTPGILAKLTSEEAEQLLEASRADRKAAALEEARKAAEAESERWRRRESLVHAQLDTIDSKIRTIESDIDAMSLERDALEKERDARKAAVARGRSRPGRAILPHKGPNGTWRRPIVVECRNGMAILQPKGQEFGLMELESGFGAHSNPFVAAVAREAIRVQGQATPDGEQAVPYIFFVVRPDGIRPYYEARGRLEPLGITFGYELADQEWQIDFPDLDDVATWDGSAPRRPAGPEDVASKPANRGDGPGGSRAEDSEIPSWPGKRPGSGQPGEGDFAWPPKPRFLAGGGASMPGRPDPGAPAGPGGGRLGGLDLASGPPAGYPSGDDPGQTSAGNAGPDGAGDGNTPGSPAAGGGLARAPRVPDAGLQASPGRSARRGKLGGIGPEPAGMPGAASSKPGGGLGGPGDALLAGTGPGAGPVGAPIAGLPDGSILAASGSGARPRPPGMADPEPAGTGGSPGPQPGPAGPAGQGIGAGAAPGDLAAITPDDPADAKKHATDPGTAFVWPAGGPGPDRGKPSLPPMTRTDAGAGPTTTATAIAPDDLGGVASSGPEGKPASSTGAPGGSSIAQASGESPASGSGSVQGQPPGSSTTAGGTSPPGQPGPGIALPSGMTPPPGLTGTPPIPPPSPSSRSRPMPRAMPEPGSRLIDRTFEVVVVCGPRGVIVQPGGYRVTSDALRERDGLFKKQIVGLVKGRRLDDPKATVEPKIRFLVQPGGYETYRVARSQFLLSGLDWPETFHVADPDPLAILPSEGW